MSESYIKKVLEKEVLSQIEGKDLLQLLGEINRLAPEIKKEDLDKVVKCESLVLKRIIAYLEQQEFFQFVNMLGIGKMLYALVLACERNDEVRKKVRDFLKYVKDNVDIVPCL